VIRDVVIVGGGVVGTAIARELSRFELRCTLSGTPDVGRGQKAKRRCCHRLRREAGAQ
jgi:glycine/D-amino acid oxidase-like deaminating enzyme